MSRADILLVSLGATAGLREADAELAASLRRAGASVATVVAARPPTVRTFALTDLLWASAARRAAAAAPQARRDPVLERHGGAAVEATRGRPLRRARGRQPPGPPRRVAAAGRAPPTRGGTAARAVERGERSTRRRAITLRALVVPVPVEPSGAADGRRDIAVVTYAADPPKKGLDLLLAAWRQIRREGEELVVVGMTRREVPLHVGSDAASTPGVRYMGTLPREEYRDLLRRARVFATAPRREDYGIAQLEALADGAQLVTDSGAGAVRRAAARARRSTRGS